jgi:hypothetical protein
LRRCWLQLVKRLLAAASPGSSRKGGKSAKKGSDSWGDFWGDGADADEGDDDLQSKYHRPPRHEYPGRDPDLAEISLRF